VRKYALILLAMVTGCAAVPQSDSAAPSQPRALQWGAGNPFCLILCFATASAVDAEGSGAAVGGTNTQRGSLAVGMPSPPSPIAPATGGQ